MEQLRNLTAYFWNPITILVVVVVSHAIGFIFSLTKFLFETPEEYIDALIARNKKMQILSVNDVKIGFYSKSYLPILILSVIALCYIQDKIVRVLALLIFLIYLLKIVFIYKHRELEILLFISYANASAIVLRIFIQAFLAVLILSMGNTIWGSLDLWPILCFFECLLGIVSLIQPQRKKQKTVISIPKETISLLMEIQSVFVLFYWIFGTLYFVNSKIHHLHLLSWHDWISVLLFVHEHPYPGLFSLGLLVLVLLIVYLNGRYVFFIQKSKKTQKHMCLQDIQKATPFLLVVLVITTGAFVLSKRPNYINSIMLPVDAVFLDDVSRWTAPLWSNSENKLANILPNDGREMDGYEIVFQNGITMYFDSEWLLEPSAYIARLTILDDFSDRPYLRLYAKMESDGIVSFFAENQGGIAAQNCSFELCDNEELLKEHFAYEFLHINVDKIEPQETVCLVTLRNQDMIKPCYTETAIKISVNASFFNGLNAWRISRQIVGKTHLSLRGITNTVGEEEWFFGTNNLMVATDSMTSWSGQLVPKNLGKDTRYTFKTENTSLIELSLRFKNFYGGYYELPPLIAVFEVE